MKAELMQKITPILEVFVDKTLEQFSDLDKLRKSLKQKEFELEAQIEDQKVITARTKVKEKEQGETFDKKVSELDTELTLAMEQKGKYIELEKELKETQEETIASNELARIELAVQKDNTEVTKQTKEQAKIEKARYERLLTILGKDQNSIAEDKKNLKIDKEKLEVREVECENKKTANTEEANRLNMLDLELKVREKEVARLVKRYNLEQQIGVTNV